MAQKNGGDKAQGANQKPSEDCPAATDHLNFELTPNELIQGRRPGEINVRRESSHSHLFGRAGPGHFAATPEPDGSLHPVEKGYPALKQSLIGRPRETTASEIDQLVLVPIDDVNYASLRAMEFALSLAQDVVVVHVSTSEQHTNELRIKMASYVPDLKLSVIDSPYPSLVRPLLSYVDAVHRQRSDAFVTIVLPGFIPTHWWEGLLHNRTAATLRRAFERHLNVAVVLVPYLLENSPGAVRRQESSRRR